MHGDHILRFARTAEVAVAHHREVALLPLLARTVSFAAPVPDFFGTWADRTCMGYPVIDGRPLTDADDLLPVLDADLGAALTRELRHGLAVGDAAIVSEALVCLRGRLSF